MCYYFCYMKLIDAILGLFSFTSVDGTLYMTRQMTTPAFTGEHLMMMIVAPVSFLFCIVLAPLLIALILHINRRRHSDTRIRTMFGFILDGYQVCFGYSIYTCALFSLSLSSLSSPFLKPSPPSHIYSRSFGIGSLSFYYERLWSQCVRIRLAYILSCKLRSSPQCLSYSSGSTALLGRTTRLS